MIVLALWALAAATALQDAPLATAPAAPTAAARTADAPASPVTPATLDGAAPAQVRARLGTPAVEHAEGAGAIWTYRLTRCALFVYFSDVGQGLRVSGADTGPRRHGETPPDVATCLAAAQPTAPRPAPAPVPASPAGPEASR